MSAWIGLAAIGGLGALLRFGLDAAVERRATTPFPLGTFVVNATGAFALGVLTGAGVAGNAMFIVGTGLIGSYTTFSTWIFETQRLAEDGETAHAIANVVLSIAVGVGAGALGWAVGAA